MPGSWEPGTTLPLLLGLLALLVQSTNREAIVNSEELLFLQGLRRSLLEGRAIRTQFTCFIGTNAQILTQKALPGSPTANWKDAQCWKFRAGTHFT